MNEAKVKAACEQAFQNGMPRTLIVNGYGAPVRGCDSRANALLVVDPEQSVWTRAKVPKEKRFEWKCIKRAY